MKKKVFIIYGWDGYPEEGWFPWLKTELEKNDFQVQVPTLPQADEPRINSWVPALAKSVGAPDKETYFVGHSMGCQTIIRYLAEINEEVGGAIFVAGFLKTLTNLEDDDIVRSVADEWLQTPVDLNKVKANLNKSVAIFSDNDPYVSLDNINEFKNILKSQILIEKNMGHFSGSSGIVTLPIALKSLLAIAK